MAQLGVWVCVFSLLAGWGREVQPPEPLPLEQLPAAFEKAFRSGSPGTKEIAARVVAQVRAGDHPKAFGELQTLVGQSGLTADQSQFLSRALLSLNQALQSAQSEGNKAAAQALRLHRENK